MDAIQPVYTPPAPAPAPMMPATTSLPGVLDLLRDGFMTYSEQLAAFLGIGILMTVVTTAYIIVIGVCANLLITLASNFAVVLLSAFAMLVGIILFYWFISWFVAAELHACLESPNKLSVVEALGRARPQIGSFIWVAILTTLVLWGAAGLVTLGSLAVTIPLFIYGLNIPGLVVSVLFSFGVVLALLILVAWFGFSSWVVTENRGTGLRALAISKHLSTDHLPKVVWDTFGVGLILGIFYVLVVGIIGYAIGIALPASISVIVIAILQSLVMSLVFLPIVCGSFGSLYRSITAVNPIEAIDTDGKEHGEHRGVLSTLAVVGFVSILITITLIVLGLTLGYRTGPSTANNTATNIGTNSAVNNGSTAASIAANPHLVVFNGVPFTLSAWKTGSSSGQWAFTQKNEDVTNWTRLLSVSTVHTVASTTVLNNYSTFILQQQKKAGNTIATITAVRGTSGPINVIVSYHYDSKVKATEVDYLKVYSVPTGIERVTFAYRVPGTQSASMSSAAAGIKQTESAALKALIETTFPLPTQLPAGSKTNLSTGKTV